MPTGYVQRWLGKVAAKRIDTPQGGLYIGGTQLTPSAADLNTAFGGSSNAAASTAATVPSYGYHTFPGVTAAKAYALADPVAGRRVTLATVDLSSAARTISVETTGVVIGTTLANKIAFSNDVLQSITLMGISTSRFLVDGGFPLFTVGQTSATTGAPALTTA